MNVRRSLIFSALLSLCFLIITFIATNGRISFGGEKAKLQWFEILSQWNEKEKENEWTDSVLLIDTHYDKQMVLEKDNDGNPIGMVAATDKQKLKKLLEYLYTTNNYRYIILDIFLDQSISQPEDSSLYALIATMPRIVIPIPENSQLGNSRLESKAGSASYGTAIWENDFVKYPFITDGKESMALKMYRELTGRSITKHGLLYMDNWPARHSAILTYELRETEELSEQKLYLGWIVGDTIGGEIYPSMLEVPNLADKKYVLIGDYEDDRHNTYIGEMSGALINFNAYLTLLYGHHRISLWMFVFLWGAFFILIWLTIRHTTFSRIFMWLGSPFYLTLTCLVCYRFFHEVYDILIATSLFYLLETTMECINNRQVIYKKINIIWQQIKLWERRFILK